MALAFRSPALSRDQERRCLRLLRWRGDLDLDLDLDLRLGLERLRWLRLRLRLRLRRRRLEIVSSINAAHSGSLRWQTPQTPVNQLADAMAPLRVLCLHGFRTNGEVLRLQTQALRSALGPGAELTFVDAPMAATGPAYESVRLLFARQAPFFQWWDARRLEGGAWAYDGCELAMDSLVARVHALGPVDVLLGFSQGAAAATMLTAHFQQRYGRVPWRVNVLVCGFLPRTAQTKHLFEDAAGGARHLDVASVHVIGLEDELAPQSEKLFRFYDAAAKSARKFEHKEGHRFPSPGKHSHLYAEIADAVVELAGPSPPSARF